MLLGLGAVVVLALTLVSRTVGTAPTNGSTPTTAAAPPASAQPQPQPEPAGDVLKGLPAQTGGGQVAADSVAARAAQNRELAKTYTQAATRIARLPAAKVPGSPTARLVAALRRTSKAYSAAAAAATAGDVAAYAAAVEGVTAARKAVDSSVAALGGATTSQPARTDTTGSGSDNAQPEEQDSSQCGGDSTSDDPSDDECEP